MMQAQNAKSQGGKQLELGSLLAAGATKKPGPSSDEERGASQGEADTGAKSMIAEATYAELVTELRLKYLSICKSIYWSYWEEGQCMPESVVVLLGSADEASDDAKDAMVDWPHAKYWCVKPDEIKIMNRLGKLPCIGGLFRW